MEAAYGGFGCVGGGFGGGGWVAVPGPDLRRQVIDTMVRTLALLYRREQNACFQFAANLEATIFRQARSVDEYMRTLSWNIANLGSPQPAPGRQQQMQMRQQMLPAHPVQAVQGGNSWVPAMPQAATNVAVPTRMPSQMQGMINAKQQHSESTPMPEQVLNSQPGGITPSAPPNNERRNQPAQRAAQAEGTQGQAQCNPASVMLQNAATVGPNAHQVHLFRQNAGGVSMQPTVPFQIQQQQQQLLMWMNHQRQMQMQRHQMHRAQQSNVAGTQIGGGHPAGQNNQQQIEMLLPEPVTLHPLQTAADQQSNSSCLNPETPTTMESAEGVDRREEIFQKVSSLKDAYLSDLMELDTSLIDHKITDEELESLPKQEAQAYRIKAPIKDRARTALDFLQLQKGCIDECTEEELCRQESSINDLMDFHRKREAMITEIVGSHLPQQCHEPPQTPDLTFLDLDDQRDEQEKPAEASISQSSQNNNDDIATSSDFQQLLHELHVEFFQQVLHDVRAADLDGQRDEQEKPAKASISQSSQNKSDDIATSLDFQQLLHELDDEDDNLVGQAELEDDVMQQIQRMLDDRYEAAVANDNLVGQAESEDEFFQQLHEIHEDDDFQQILHEMHEDDDFQQLLHEMHEDDDFQQLLDEEHDDRAEAAVAKKRPLDHLIDDDAETALPQEEQSSAAYLMWLKQEGDGPTPASGMMESPAMEPESSPRSSPKRQKTDDGDSVLVREIKAINDKLIDTMITVTGDGGDGGATSIKFIYTSVALAKDMKEPIMSHAGTSLVKSANLSVPADYPLSSPVLLDNELPQRGMYGEIAGMVDVAFQRALGELPEPRSIEQMARAWDASVRGAVTEFARRRGGGTFSSAYGRWESCTDDE